MASWNWGNVNKKPAMEQEDKVQSVQARIIQQQYVRAQIKEISHPTNKDRMVGLALDQLTKDLHVASVDKKKKWTDRFKNKEDTVWQHYERMEKRFQDSRLTINFPASSWFSQPNNYESYTQMYERAVKKVGDPNGVAKEMRLKTVGSNFVAVRDKADTRATFTNEAVAASSGTFEALKRIMDTGGLNAVADTPGEFTAKNPYFNPKSKQLFAALDYGHRPHGGCLYYGMSFMVLKPKFMTNALFFGSDTFTNTTTDKMTSANAMNQVSFGMLGALYGQAGNYLKGQLYQRGVLGQKLPDVPDNTLATAALVEAHLFEPLIFRSGIDAIYLSPRDQITSQEKHGTAWTDIRHNASAFAKANGAELFFID